MRVYQCLKFFWTVTGMSIKQYTKSVDHIWVALPTHSIEAMGLSSHIANACDTYKSWNKCVGTSLQNKDKSLY